MTVAELLARASSAELTEWMALARIRSEEAARQEREHAPAAGGMGRRVTDPDEMDAVADAAQNAQRLAQERPATT